MDRNVVTAAMALRSPYLHAASYHSDSGPKSARGIEGQVNK
jgi:hypothetical protein